MLRRDFLERLGILLSQEPGESVEFLQVPSGSVRSVHQRDDDACGVKFGNDVAVFYQNARRKPCSTRR